MFLFSFLLSCSSSETVQATNVKTNQTVVKKEQSEGPKIIILGDSLTAGLGLSSEQAYPTHLNSLLEQHKLPSQIINAGVSGDTTAGGVRRIDWILTQNPDLVLIELGANDGLRGIPISEITANLHILIDKVQTANIDVILIGMQIPPNYGKEYATQFQGIYPAVAKEQGVPLLPFLLKDVAGVRDLNQSDGIHPTAKGHEIMAKTVYEFIKPWRNRWTANQ